MVDVDVVAEVAAEPGAQLFVGNLPFTVGWQDLKDIFSECGEIVRSDVAVNPAGRSRGFGTILYSSPAEAQAAIARYNGYEWDSRVIEVRLDQKLEQSGRYAARDGAAPVGDANLRSLYVGNVPYSIGWQDIKDLFREAGDVIRADIPSDHQGRSKGYATVVMATVEDTQKAVEMYAGYEWNGRKIEVRADNFGSPRQRPAGEERAAPRERAAPKAKQQRAQQEVTDSGKSQLFVGNLPFSAQWQEVKDLFSEIGEVEHADVAVGHDGRSRGFGQVIMANLEDAQKAIVELNGADFNGRAIEVRLDKFTNGGAAAQGGASRAPRHEAGQPGEEGCQVFVGNLPYSTRWQELKDLMKTVGHVNHADIMLDQNGRSKGCGIVVFADASDAARAIEEINGASFEGRNVLCRMDKFTA